ncbi:hypothetical protein WN55_00322 [Dufourea novaeangliae]|uniref:Uncharacterized protein n=1 Tax=Dufourea novaeangliae TaxID=178035 RepID=A0A154PAS3_DUFNO|nr:hypothetical protein WN55_00322 [Dufourea novaeangliae]
MGPVIVLQSGGESSRRSSVNIRTILDCCFIVFINDLGNRNLFDVAEIDETGDTQTARYLVRLKCCVNS